MTGIKIPQAILATRGSALAIWQANFIAEKLKLQGLEVRLNVVKTTGDLVQNRFLHEIGGKGLFIKELEEAMLQSQAHMAMHSLKDMPVKIHPDFFLAAILKRHDVSDAIVFKDSFYQKLGLVSGQVLGAAELKALGPMKVATSSLRRKSLLLQINSNTEVIGIRGNVDTRIAKLQSMDVHALIIAKASLDRLGLTQINAHILDPTWFIPCAGQGAIALEAPINSPFSAEMSRIDCIETRLQVTVERKILEALGGDCTMPFGALVQIDPQQSTHLMGRVIVLNHQGESASAQFSVPRDTAGDGQILLKTLLDQLRVNGANKILEDLGLKTRL